MDAGVFNQVTNVACLPGIQKYAFCMPDGHWDMVSQLAVLLLLMQRKNNFTCGIGFDINCGMRLVTTNLTFKEVKPKLKKLLIIFQNSPIWRWRKGIVPLTKSQFKELVTDGSKWCVDNGYGWKEDTERTEGFGKLSGLTLKKSLQRHWTGNKPIGNFRLRKSLS